MDPPDEDEGAAPSVGDTSFKHVEVDDYAGGASRLGKAAVGSAALGGATLVPLGGRDIAADAPGGPGGLAGVHQPSGVGCGLRYTHEQLAAATQGFADASACNRRGTVHRGVLAASATPVAVKRVPPSGHGPRSETAR